MNAITFIKQHGVERAKECLPAYDKHYCGLEQLFVEDLKRLVECIKTIEKIGGIVEARKFANSSLYFTADRERMHKAIADYEAIYSNTPKKGELEDLRDCDTSPNCKKYKERVGQNETN